MVVKDLYAGEIATFISIKMNIDTASMGWRMTKKLKLRIME